MVKFNPDVQAPNRDIDQALRRLRRRQRRWFFVKLLIWLFVALLAGLLYLQSSHAMRHIYLPMLSERIGTKITARDGAASIFGNAEFAGVEVLGSDGAPALSAQHLTLRVAPLSLLFHRNPVVHEATLDAIQARVNIDKDGGTNWDFHPPAQTPVRAAGAAPVIKASKKNTIDLPFTIDKLKVTNSAVQVQNAKQLDVTLTDVDLTVDSLGRGRPGVFGLTAEGYVDRPGIHHRFSVTRGSGALTEDAATSELAWNAALDVDFTPEAQAGETTQTVALKAVLDGGKLGAGGQFAQKFTLSAVSGAAPAGQLTGDINWDTEKKIHLANLEAKSLGREFLNPILAAFGPVQLERSQIDGTCKLGGSGDVVTVESSLNGRDLAFRVGTQRTVTPPVNLNFTQRGAMDTAKQLLKLDAATLAVLEAGKPVMQAQLDRPVEIQTGPAAANAPASAPARINTTLTGMPVETLQPWLIMAGVSGAEGMRGGTLNGQIAAVIENSGADIALDGRLTGSGVIVPRLKNTPLELTQIVKGRIEKLDTVTFDGSKLTAASAGRTLADAEISGKYQATAAAGKLTLKLAAPQAIATARTLGWIKADDLAGSQDGRLDAIQEITLTGKGKDSSISGSATLSGIVLAAAGGRKVPLTGKADTKLTVNDRLLNFETLKAEWTAGTGAPATLEIKGGWPLAADQGAELKLKASNIDIAPWIRLAPAQTLPLQTDETITALANGTSRISGALRLGPIPAETFPADTDPPVSMTIDHQVEKLGDQIQKLTLAMAAKTHSGAADDATFNGSGTWDAGSIALKLEGSIKSLHADAYAALGGVAAAPAAPAASAATPAPARPATAPAPAPSPAKPAAPRRVVVDVAKLDIGHLFYQKSDLSEARGAYRYENGVSEIKLEKGKLAGGTILGNGSFNAARQEPVYNWELAAQGVDIKTFLGLLSPEAATHLSGKGDIASKGTGQGFGDDGKRRLQSETGFVLKNGEIRDLFILDALAKQTRIDELKNLKYSEFTGRVSIADGVAKLTDWIEKGKDQRISLWGTWGLDGKYELNFRPSVTQALVRKGAKSDIAGQFLTDSQGFFASPLEIVIAGQGTDYKLSARASAAGKDEKQILNQNTRSILQGFAEKELQKRTKKQKKQK